MTRHRPALYLTNLSSLRTHSGRKLRTMARPRHWEAGDGCVPHVTPAPDDVAEVLAGEMTWAEYRARYDRQLEHHTRSGVVAAGVLLMSFGLGHGTTPVRDGDALFCACAAPGSPRRTHPCHLELLTPYLVRGGWDVRLHERWIVAHHHDIYERDGVEVEDVDAGLPATYLRTRIDVVYATTGEPMRPEDYGWPAAVASSLGPLP